MYFLGLITRCKDEFFIEEFCNYYLNQGVDKIYIIDDDSVDKSIYKNLTNENITIIYESNIIKNNYANILYKKIKHNFLWMIYCDVDEFITTKKFINHTIRYELENIFKDADCIKIPWVMMSSNYIENNPKSVLLENTYRWNHDKRHNKSSSKYKFRCRYNSIEVKCIFKTEKYKSLWDHHPRDSIGNCKIVDSINNNKQVLSAFYNNLREIDIKNGVLLCYHYRIISKENCINKLKTNKWYINEKFTLLDLLESDYAEVYDDTMKNKILQDCNRNYELKFVHITKTSGTFIEKLALEKNIYWGINDKNLKTSKLKNEYKKSNPSYWHAPLHFFSTYPYDKVNVKTFTIVRNPYDRIVSECHCKWGSKFAKSMETLEDFNTYISEQVVKAYDITFHHFMPQHIYTHYNGIQTIDYIIKYEEIEKFNELMKKYNLDINYVKKDSSNDRKFNIKDISKENIKLINEVYDKDFKYYNYKKII